MITFLTTFKPFTGDDAIRQANALYSWLAIHEDVEALVFGSIPPPEGLRRADRVIHCPESDWRQSGRPKLDDVFDQGQRMARNEWIVYINGDMIMGQDLLRAFQRIDRERFLLVGQRWETRHLAALSSCDPIEAQRYCDGIRREAGHWQTPTAMDYFGFRRGTLPPFPPMVPGGVLWDNYMIYHCKSHGIPVIDATPDVFAIHQTHEYPLTAERIRITYAGPAAQQNRTLAFAVNPYCVYAPLTIQDADFIQRNGRLKPAWLSSPNILHRCHTGLIRLARKTGAYSILMRCLGRKVRG